MRRSLTAYENRRNDIDTFRISPLTKTGKNHSEIRLKRDTKRVYTQANASWEWGNFEDKAASKAKTIKTTQTNRKSLYRDRDIQNLLDLLKSTDFIGRIDPDEHSNYVLNRKAAATTTATTAAELNKKNENIGIPFQISS